MKTVSYYEIVCVSYYGEPMLRLRYEVDGTGDESSLYTPEELNEILHHWREGTCLGLSALALFWPKMPNSSSQVAKLVLTHI